MKLKLTVSELSKIVGVSPRTIRYYATKNLFEESGISDNGYRYYTIEKIEELRLIVYLRYLDIPIKEIKSHLNNRSLDEYDAILEKQLHATRNKITHLQFLEKRLEKRLESINYIHSLPPLNNITIRKHPSRRILKIEKDINDPLDWEKAMIQFEQQENLPPSLIIGDIGFFVDLNKINTRHATEFTALYLISDEPLLMGDPLVVHLPEGEWLTYLVEGDHTDAAKIYPVLLAYAQSHDLTLDNYAIERVLLDHFISSDPSIIITEVQIPILA